VPLDELSRAEWLSMLAVAGQDVDLVEGTIEQNIRMARDGATMAEVAAAAELAGLAETVSALPEGYRTWIGQEGLNLSGGQRQRLGLARAAVREPQLLVLDEAMSALDFGLAHRVQTAILRHFSGRTILLITHRLETVLCVDHVICMEDGVVKAEGRPTDLLSDLDGPFSRLIRQG